MFVAFAEKPEGDDLQDVFIYGTLDQVADAQELVSVMRVAESVTFQFRGKTDGSNIESQEHRCDGFAKYLSPSGLMSLCGLPSFLCPLSSVLYLPSVCPVQAGYGAVADTLICIG